MSVIGKILTILLVVSFLLAGGGRLTVFAAASPTEMILEGLLACDEVMDLSAWGLSAEELSCLYTEILQGTPELFHVAPRLSFTVSHGTERRVEEVYPVYTMTGDTLGEARRWYRDRVTAILSRMEEDFGGRTPSEGEMVLYLHDYLAERYAYDTRGEGVNRDAFSFFRDGVGVCQAYALAFMALSRGAGLEADFVASDMMDHAWNHVRVDGVWYHVDVTRDDPIPAAEGREEVNHTRLLRSDEGMAALGYVGFSCAEGHVCDDTRFETDGEGVLGGFHGALRPFGDGWLGEAEGGAPRFVAAAADGFSTGERGDTDGDGEITPADLLGVYDKTLPEEWRGWLRGRLVE